MSQLSTTLYYVHDPMCSWCWAFRPTLTLLRANLLKQIQWQNVVGGLAPDSDQAMPEQTRQMVQGHWRNIQATVGTEFNFDFWTKCQPRRDTYKACRAVIVAEKYQLEEAMIEAIQKAYYLRAMNPSDPEMLADLAVELGLDREVFLRDFGSSEVENKLRQQFQLRRDLNVRSFPSLVLEHEAVLTPIPHDYQNFRVSLDLIEKIVSASSPAILTEHAQ